MLKVLLGFLLLFSFSAKSSERHYDEHKIILKDNLLGIHRRAVNKSVLFHLDTMLPTMGEKSFYESMKSKVVIFRKKGDSLLLKEQVHRIHSEEDVGKELWIATLKIKKKEDNYFFVDLPRDMKQIFQVQIFSHFDVQKKKLLKSPQFTSTPATLQRIRLIEAFGKNKIAFDLDYLLEGSSEINVKFFLRERTQGKKFNRQRTTSMDKLGYFSTPPKKIRGGKVIAFISKFHITKENPLVFHLSANTPADYRQAIIRGVEYWQEHLGEGLIKAKIAPSGISAPHISHNVIQWVDKNLTTARADMQIDPKTGQIHKAYVYLPAGWIHYGDQLASGYVGKSEKRLFVKNTDKDSLCPQGISSKHLSKTLSHLYKENPHLSLSKKKLLIEDLLTSVVAHEIGHTLGLRHNFGASLISNLNGPDLDLQMQRYVKNDEIDSGIILTDSVMDYPSAEIDFLLGASIRKKLFSGNHDKMSIDHLYKKVNLRGYNPTFCSDEHVESLYYLDCDLFDNGQNPVPFWVEQLQENQLLAAQVVWNEIVKVMDDRDEDEKGVPPLGTLDLSWDDAFFADRVNHTRLALALTKEGRLLPLRKSYGQKNAIKKEGDYFHEAIRNASGSVLTGKRGIEAIYSVDWEFFTSQLLGLVDKSTKYTQKEKSLLQQEIVSSIKYWQFSLTTLLWMTFEEYAKDKRLRNSSMVALKKDIGQWFSKRWDQQSKAIGLGDFISVDSNFSEKITMRKVGDNQEVVVQDRSGKSLFKFSLSNEKRVIPLDRLLK